MPEYRHRHGGVERTVAGSVLDRQLAARAADGRTNVRRADDEDKAEKWAAEDQPADDTEG